MPVIAHPARRIELPHHQDLFGIVEQNGASEIQVFDMDWNRLLMSCQLKISKS
ncbi:MAG: hypothetical protein H6Q41_3108 [Deltaproteobacteria bacterium]|jgi:hypothetical protein|nr:hypothetical protein [Deltaproteobacteria bacterium]